MASNLASFFSGGARRREAKDTLALYREAKHWQRESPFYKEDDLAKFVREILVEVGAKDFLYPVYSVDEAIWNAIFDLLNEDGFQVQLPDEDGLRGITLEQGVAFRTRLKRNKRFIFEHEKLLPLWAHKVTSIFAGLLDYFPLSAFEEQEGRDDNAITFPEVEACDLCENLSEALERILVTLLDVDVRNAGLFESVREQLEENVYAVSGVSRYDRNLTPQKLITPTRSKLDDPATLVHTYLQGTPFLQLFQAKVPFEIPFPARFEHTHILAGTGHGKTQLLQFLIHHDLLKALDDGRSVVVMDSQGDLIRTVSHLKLFSSAEERNLADRFVLVDPTDVDYPVGLNMFDFDRARMETLSAKDRETILNATVETYEYFFGALLGAELTQRQGVVFRYIARLMMEIPNATIHTLLELMLNGEKYRPYMEQLSGTARTFFLTQFFDRQFVENKKQITARLWGVLSNTTLERMFSHPKNKLDLFRLTQEGKIILVNTAQDFLGQDGSSIFGRFIISLLTQAAIQRAVLPAHERTPTFAYIDEAEEYFDDNIDRLVNQARKYKIGLLFSHQNLDQLSPALRASVLASTSIKFAGGLSSKDARALDAEFRTDADMLLAQKKRGEHTEFACYVKNYTGKALSVRIPLGYVERQPMLEDREYEWLLRENRNTYGVEAVVPEIEVAVPAPKTERKKVSKLVEEEIAPTVSPAQEPEEIEPIVQMAKEALEEEETEVSVQEKKELRARAPIPRYEPKEQGGGGKQHKYLAHLVKQLAEERGFRASIEEVILDGSGRVDVALSRGERKIAVEISVTTGRDWELGNVEKCLSAGFEEVLVVSTNERHLKSLARFIPTNLDEAVRDKVEFMSPEGLIAYLDTGNTEVPVATEKMVRGYKVRVSHKGAGNAEAEARRSAIAEVIAQSMLRGKE